MPTTIPTLSFRILRVTLWRVTADLYKRPKVPEDARLAPYFAWRRYIDCTRSLEPGAALFDPQLGQRVRDFFEQALPLYEYFYRFTLGQ